MSTIKLKRNLAMQDGADPKTQAPLLNELWEELLKEQGTCWGKVISDSMRPLVQRGDRVLVEKAFPDKVRFGDIAVFRRNGQLIIHRVLGKREFIGKHHFLEKGDAILHTSLVPANNIIGRVSVIKNSDRTIRTLSGSGRICQLTLACISYTSLWLWRVLEYCLTRGERAAYNHRWETAYHRFFSLLRRIVVRSLR